MPSSYSLGLLSGLREAGLTGVSVTLTHQVADGVHSAIIRAAKPDGASQ